MKFETKFPDSWDYYGITLENIADDPKRREDLRHIPQALEMGWTVEEGKTFADGITFRKGNTYIWGIMEGWQCADVVEGHYCNHRPYMFLEDALTMEA